MFAYARGMVLGCCLLAALSNYGSEYLGKAAFWDNDDLYVQELPDGMPRKVDSFVFKDELAWDVGFSDSGRWLLVNERNDKDAGASIYDLTYHLTPPHLLQGGNFCWSPSSDVLAYTRGFTGIYVTSPGLWKETTLLQGVRNTTNIHSIFPGAIEDLCWSPDGKRLAYIIWRKPRRTYPNNNWDAYGEIHVINTDGSGDRLLLRDTPFGSDVEDLSWTPDGRYLLYFRATDQSADIWKANMPFYALPLAGGRPKLISNNTWSSRGTYYHKSFAPSPDGRQLVMSEGESGQEWSDDWLTRQLTLVTLRTGARRELTPTSRVALSPVWSPQGDALAFVSAPSTTMAVARQKTVEQVNAFWASRRIALVHLPRGNISQHVDDALNIEEEDPVWSADGSQLLFQRSKPDKRSSDLWTLNVQSGKVRQLNIAGVGALWLGQHLDTPGWVGNGTLLAPLRALVEALGGTVSADAPRIVTVTLDGKTQHYCFAGDADYLNPDNDSMWQQSGVSYCPLNKLAYDFDLQLSWNAPAAEAVVNDTHASRIVIVPSKPIIMPSVLLGGRHPLLRVTRKYGIHVIGGTSGHRYLDDEAMAAHLHGGELYRVYSLTKSLGTYHGGRPRNSELGKEEEAGEELKLTPKIHADAVALDASWNALPHVLRRENPKEPIYQQMARQVLASRGITSVTPHVIQAFTCDLVGDGHPVSIISATLLSYSDKPTKDEYSFVAVQQHGRIRVLDGAFSPMDINLDSEPDRYSILSCLDIDGDGKMEVIIGFNGYEWWGEKVFSVTADHVVNLFGSYEGGN